MKSKIEEKIEKAREATNEMFAAFDELNGSLSKNVIEVSINAKRESLNIPSINCDCWFAKWMPKKGEYATTVGLGGEKLIVIFKKWNDSEAFFHYAGLNTYGKLTIGTPFGFIRGDIIRPATPEEIALLDSKLAEQGKRFDKEELELVDIPKEPKFKKGDLVRTPDGYIFEVSEAVTNTMKTEWLYCKNPNVTYFGNYIEESKLQKWEPKHKEPIIGEMAIMWRSDKGKALCRIYGDYEDGRHYDSVGIWADHAILFESPEQYKAFLKS